MDPQSVSQSQIDSLSDAEKRDLQQSLKNEMQKAKIQECMASLQLLLLSLNPFLLSPSAALCLLGGVANALVRQPFTTSPTFAGRNAWRVIKSRGVR